MESLKLPSKGNKSSGGSIPIAIKFTAGEDNVEDFVKISDSQSSSPQQNDDTSWHKEFLQGNFFGRKRSGSIEERLSSSTNGNTWQLIKGKVTQAMEDIKSSKSDMPNKNEDSDLDTSAATINSSISDDLSDKLPISSSLKDRKTIAQDSDSDNDIDFDIFSSEPSKTSSMLKMKLDKFKNRKLNKPTITTSGDSVSTTTAGETTLKTKTSFLRRRKKSPSKTPNNPNDDSSNSKPIDPSKTVEIESGVEMMEDMILVNNVDVDDSEFKDALEHDKSDDLKDRLEGTLKCSSFNDILSSQMAGGSQTVTNNVDVAKKNTMNDIAQKILHYLYANRSIVIGLIFLIFLYTFKIPDFLKGVLTCMFGFVLFSNLYELAIRLLNKIVLSSDGAGAGGVEKSIFAIPDYKTMPICEIPAAEEHKALKSYSGWMNEINNYDPSNYHISMTRSVFVKLDGTTLRISNTTLKIPKRAMWNEKVIDKKMMKFTRHRFFELLDARLEMCPAGLARKRYYSRKYPIQLTIRLSNTSSQSSSELLQQKTDDLPSPGDISTTTASAANKIKEQNDSLEKTDSSSFENDTCEMTNADNFDIGAAIMNSDANALQKLNENNGMGKAGGSGNKDQDVPCADETRILLFARTDREKEDWYRRFKAASLGLICDQEHFMNDMTVISEEEVLAAFGNKTSTDEIITTQTDDVEKELKDVKEVAEKNENIDNGLETVFEGLLMTTCASRGPSEYVQFMSKYQQACKKFSNKKPVVIKSADSTPKRKSRREKKVEDELWKGVDQSLYLGPTNNVVWGNVLIGRILYSIINDTILLKHIQDFLEKKLTAIRLPSFMEDVHVADINLGDTPPLIHRISQPLLDERGVWMDADVTYEGLINATISTKLNLMRLKKQEQPNTECPMTLPNELALKVICDSGAESSGASSSESDSSTQALPEAAPDSAFYSSPGGSAGGGRKILRIVDRITASNLFQSATEISYIQRAMENMSTYIKLHVELKGLVGRVVINLPPPPSDRLWIGFRGPPRLWLTAKPAVGEHTFDWTMVTSVIENKLCEEVNKYLVYPNMVDIILPFLGQPTYQTKE